ncbi:MAG: ABC transporter substrate-binding protein [Deltaproteobacteria bacterium]|nr:ABC transporter substrate-binding protein [Deltaproteobacteria bacterium]
MICKSLPFNKAVPAVMAGMAFFFAACGPGTPVKKGPATPVAADQFVLAEAYREQGHMEKALETYDKYVRQNPWGEGAAKSLHRMGEIYSKLEKYEEALTSFKRILKDHPRYTERALVRSQVASQFHHLGNFALSMDAATQWLVQYPQHPLRGEVMMLVGDNHMAMGDRVEAFTWWLKAEKASVGHMVKNAGGTANLEKLSDALRRQALLSEKMEDLIGRSGTEDLEQYTRHAVGSAYAPGIYHRMAVLFLKQKELQKARGAAMSLVESTREPYWVSEGRRLLEKISSLRRVVGCLLPLSGPFSFYGREILKGIRLGMARLGKWDEGADLDLVVKDTGGREDRALAGLEALAAKGDVMAVIGPLASRTASAVARRAQALGVPMIALTQKEGIALEGDMVFRNFLTPSREVSRLLKEAIKEKGVKRFAILYPDNPYGRFFMDVFQKRAKEMGASIAGAVSYHPHQRDFTRQIQKLAGPYQRRSPTSSERSQGDERRDDQAGAASGSVVPFEALFIPDTFQKAAMIAPQLPFHDISGVLLMGTSLWQSPQLIELAGDDIEGAIFPSGFFKGSGALGVEAFVEGYNANFHAAPGVLAATGYDTIRLLGKVLADRSILTRKDLRDMLLRYKDFRGVTGDISFDSQGEVEKTPFLLTVSGNKMILCP